VQRYIDQPLLIGGYKSHLRVHMLMTAVKDEGASMRFTGLAEIRESFLGTPSFKSYKQKFELDLIAVEIVALFRAFSTACLSQVRPKVRAYIHKELCVMFTTMPYTLDPEFLDGSEKGTFEPVRFLFVYSSFRHL